MCVTLSDDACIASVTVTGETATVFNFEVDGWHTYHVGELGVWVHNADCFARTLINAGFARPAAGTMMRPHAHHIVYKRGFGEVQQQIAGDGRAILIRNGIDIDGRENLVWAPNVAGQHSPENITSVVNDLRSAESLGGTSAEVRARLVDALRRQGELASRR